MNALIQPRPLRDTPPVWEFETLPELLAHPVLKAWQTVVSFRRFSYTDMQPTRRSTDTLLWLLAETDQMQCFVGTLDAPVAGLLHREEGADFRYPDIPPRARWRGVEVSTPMNEFIEHRPAFVDRGEPRFAMEFATLPELLRMPCVKDWQAMTGFHRFSVSADAPLLLMAEFTDKFWVVGTLRHPVEGLPTWVPPAPPTW